MEQSLAGAFVVEPGNLWRRRLKRLHLDKAPGVASVNGEDAFTCPGGPPAPVAVSSVPWRGEALASEDVWTRTEAMDRAGVQAHVLFPTFAWSLFAIKDDALRADCIRSYNNWLFDLCAATPSRLLPAPLISSGEAGVAELEHCLGSKNHPPVKVVIVGVEDAARPDAAIQDAKSRGLEVVLARAGGAGPVGDMSRFTREAADLAHACETPGLDLLAPQWRGGAVLELARVAQR